MIRSYQTPGVYFEKPQQPETPTARRTDIAGFVGMAERGPLHTPQRLTTWREYQQVFGGFLSYSHLAYSVRAFFENGGQVCWVVRVADVRAARMAALNVPNNEDDLPNYAYHVSAANPGTWGDGLAISVQAASLAATQSAPIGGLPEDRLAVISTARLETGSRVLLTQRLGANLIQKTLMVESVDVIRGVVHFDATLSEFDRANANSLISLESQEFTLLVYEDDQVVERFANLARDARHSRYAIDLVNSESRLIRLAAGEGEGLPALPWRGLLAGGLNGLRTMTIFDSIGTPQGDIYGLSALAEVGEISLLAMPDLTVRPTLPTPLRRQVRRKIDPCALDLPAERTTLIGRILDAETRTPLTGVKISDGLTEVSSGADGTFTLPDMFIGPLELALNLTGFDEKIVPVSVVITATGTQDLGDILVAPLDLPPALTWDDIYYGQAEMVAQCERLRDRFAIIDPPLALSGSLMASNDLMTWRAHFDTAFAALYYPWLIVRDPVQADVMRMIPPSGHVAGVYAATDLSEGVFRPPANRALDFVNDVGARIDDAEQGVLNPRGINIIRAFPGRGIRIWGARTMSSESAWRFVNVRRLMTMLEITLQQSLQWAVFEPNSPVLQLGLRMSITTLLDGLWRRGAFVGRSPDEAYSVRCDSTTTTPDAIANGQIIAEVRVAPVVPYEFVVLQLGITTDEIQISEV